MSKWSVLVIDDEALDSTSSRHQHYLKLQDVPYDQKAFDLTFASEADEARRTLRGCGADIVLLDVRLRYWGDDDRGVLFKELFKLADEFCVVALVSSAWDSTSMALVRDFLVSHPQVRVPLFFTFRDFELGAFAAITTQLVTHLRRQRSLHTLDLTADAPLRLLHISDLHFGSPDAKQTLASMADTRLLCDKIKSAWPADAKTGAAGPHVVAVTGDIANTGHPEEYDQAFAWFSKFAHQFGWSLPTPRVLLVPGNHDFSIPLCGAQQLQLNSAKKLELTERTEHGEVLTAYAMQPFKDFARRVSSTSFSQDQALLGCWTEFGFVDYGVVFSGFNTSKTAATDSWPKRWIDKDDFVKVKDALEARLAEFNQKKLLHISLAHHSPVSYPGVTQPIDNQDEYLEHFMDTSYRPELLLHGHVHKRWGTSPDKAYFVVAAPTPTKNPDARSVNSPLGVNLLTLHREEAVVTRVDAGSLVRLEDGWTEMRIPKVHRYERLLAMTQA